MRETAVPMRMIDGPIDPNSGLHMAERYLEVIHDPDVVLLDDNIGHWPQIEAPEAVLTSAGCISVPSQYCTFAVVTVVETTS
ncbi:putative hydrolase [Mycobacteroides abscessus subsp. abscessus]|nr:putative hydrolase [Mycobacteroides abscessus subsp. abscessus]